MKQVWIIYYNIRQIGVLRFFCVKIDNMKITRLTLWRVALISKTPYYMASGKTCDVVDTMVLRLDTDSGLCGFGETCPIPHYLPAYANGVAPALAEMASVILGADPVGPVAVMTRLDKMLPGHPYAKSAVDIALWDITAQAAGLPLFALLGGRQITQLPLYHSITCVAPEEMAKIAKESQKEGITQFQVKLGVDATGRPMSPACAWCVRRSARRPWFMAIGTAG